MPTYSLSQQMRANSPQTGRATGLRHGGGGTIHGGGGKSSGGKKPNPGGPGGGVIDDPSAGFTQGPSGGLNIQGINPSPGAMYRPEAAPMQTQNGQGKGGGGGSKGGGSKGK